jgi:hypothetical protein
MLPFSVVLLQQIHCHATVTITLLWKYNELTVMQQYPSRYYSNATPDLTCHNTLYVSAACYHHQMYNI